GALAISQVFWSQAVVAEVYALHAVFVAAILLWVARSNNRARAAEPSDAPTGAKLSIPAFLIGLALTHHRTIILLFPALGIYLWQLTQPTTGTRWQELIAQAAKPRVVAAFVLPLLLYLYLPL